MPVTGLTLITLTGKYLLLNGSPASGTVTFTPSTVLINAVANEIVMPVAFTATLNSSGAFSIALPATNDPDLSPQGFTYQVTESIDGTAGDRTYSISLPHDAAGGTLDLADLVPVPDSSGTSALAGVKIKDEGATLVNVASTLNFVGTAVSVTDSGGGEVAVNVTGTGGGGYATVAEEGVALVQRSTLNFVGMATAADDSVNARTNVTITDPVPAHVGATDPHTQYRLESALLVNADISGTAAIAESKLSLASDAAAGTASRRTLGTGATQAAAGNHGHSGTLDANARVAVKKAGVVVGTRRGINLVEGSNVTLTVTDDAAGEEVDVVIASSGGGSGVAATLWDANTLVKADVDDTPVALAVPPSTFVGRKAIEGIVAMSTVEAATLLAGTSSGTLAAGNDARFTTLTANRQTGTTYTLALSDAGKVIESDNAASNTVTIPTNATVAFAVGTVISGMQYGAGQTSVAGASGVTLRAPGGLVVGERYGTWTARKIAADEWEVQVGLPVLLAANRQTGTAYTLVISDANKVVEMSNAGANTLTVPSNGSVGFPIGTVLEVLQYGAGQTTIAGGVGVTLRASGGKLKLAAQYAQASLRKIAADEWIVAGELVA